MCCRLPQDSETRAPRSPPACRGSYLSESRPSPFLRLLSFFPPRSVLGLEYAQQECLAPILVVAEQLLPDTSSISACQEARVTDW